MTGQLKNSGLTLGDIETIRASFIETLKGRFHVRVRYPGNEQIELAGESEAVRALPEPAPTDMMVAETQETAGALLPQDLSSN
jgi:hypothetical protein